MNDKSLEYYQRIFVNTVSKLLTVQLPQGGQVFIKIDLLGYICFNPKDFKKVLGDYINVDGERAGTVTTEVLQVFRDLGWLVCKDKRFTDIQNVKGKARRVITVDETKYNRLQELLPNRKMEMFIKNASAYLDTVDELLESGKVYERNDELHYINFNAQEFREVLATKIGQGEKIKDYLSNFRTLSWIICKEQRFSNIQRVEGKVSRVVTVNSEIYSFMKNITEISDEK